MTNADLYSLPILAPKNAEIGVYNNGEVFFSPYGKVYTYTSPSGLRVRISRRSIYQLSYDGVKYVKLESMDDLESYRIMKQFTIASVDNGTINLGTDIFSNRPPF